MLQGLDGMTYKGTLGKATVTSNIHVLPTTGVRNGDTYVVISEGMTKSEIDSGDTIVNTGSELANGTRIGDMFIASGTEDNATGFITAPQWTYIPSGNDSAAQFTYSSSVTTTTNTIDMSNEAGATVMSISLQASTGINIVSAADGDRKLISTISHAAYNTTATTSTAASTQSFAAISSLTLENGHVVGINTETFNPVVYELTDQRAATNLVDSSVVNGTRVGANNAGANDVTVATTLGNAEGATINSSILKLSSTSIKLSKGNEGEVVMNMEWGTF